MKSAPGSCVGGLAAAQCGKPPAYGSVFLENSLMDRGHGEASLTALCCGKPRLALRFRLYKSGILNNQIIFFSVSSVVSE